MIIDIERLRQDLEDECYGAFFGDGFGGALMESCEIEDASPEELIQIARRNNVDLEQYEIPDWYNKVICYAWVQMY